MPWRTRSSFALCALLLLGAACAERREPTEPASPEVDRSFIDGSGVTSRALTEQQVENLVLLGKVWGFAKYHHPAVTAGEVNWDWELFRVLPEVLQSADRVAATTALSQWLAKFDPIPACQPCATPDDDAQFQPDVAWINDVATLGANLSGRLTAIHRNRTSIDPQQYVSLAPNVGNPVFRNENTYRQMPAGDAGYNLLALFRFWNIVEYWFPYRNIIGEDWDNALRDFVPRMMAQSLSDEAYRLTLIQFAARINDTHANLWSVLSTVRPPLGDEDLLVRASFIDGQAVVTGYHDNYHGEMTGLRVGDVIEQIDGQPIASVVQERSPNYPASNEASRLRDIGANLFRGTGPVQVDIRRAEGSMSMSLTRTRYALARLKPHTHDRPGPTFQMLSDDVAYIKLSTVVLTEVPGYIEQALGAKLLVLDLRNYPSAFVPFVLGRHLVTAPTPFARFTIGSLANPGTMRWGQTVTLPALAPHFSGAIAILVDELTQSSAEYHAMAFRAAPRAFVVGSTTAGADGNVSRVPLPGDLEAMITGIGVFYPDRTPTQRVGIVPDVFVRPTVDGLRAGRDEVLEAAIEHALGRQP